MATRGVLCEAIEMRKGNDRPGELNGCYKHIHILDLQGLSFGHFSAGVRRVVKQVVIEMGNLYPDTVYKLFFVKAPFAFRAIWKMTTPFVHQVTLDKVHIVGRGKTMLKYFEDQDMPISEVPDFLGGGHCGSTLMDFIEEKRSS